MLFFIVLTFLNSVYILSKCLVNIKCWILEHGVSLSLFDTSYTRICEEKYKTSIDTGPLLNNVLWNVFEGKNIKKHKMCFYNL